MRKAISNHTILQIGSQQDNFRHRQTSLKVNIRVNPASQVEFTGRTRHPPSFKKQFQAGDEEGCQHQNYPKEYY